MTRTDFNQGVTLKVFLHDHIRTDGTSTVYLRVIIDRRKREFNLKVYWPQEYFDHERQQAKSRYPKDPDLANVNMIINEAKGKGNKIKLRYFSDSKRLSLDLFQKEFENYESRDNFLLYYENKMNEREKHGHISSDTRRRHNTNLNRFKGFIKGGKFLSMADLNKELMLQFRNYLRKNKKLSFNTAVGALKNVQTYINLAIEEGFKIIDPFEQISLGYKPGERQALNQAEVNRLKELFLAKSLTAIGQEVLRKFLFSCFTGIRLGDNAVVDADMISAGVLKINLIKGRRYGKQVTIPLPEFAKELISGRDGLLFRPIASQTCNDWLKIIGPQAKIEKLLTFRVSRDTFATLFITMGGDAVTLRDLLGHTSIKTTEIYIKMSEDRKTLLMNNFNNL